MGRWKIWITYYDHRGHVSGYAVYHRSYKYKYSAVRRARELYGNPKFAAWVVDKDRPLLFPDYI